MTGTKDLTPRCHRDKKYSARISKNVDLLASINFIENNKPNLLKLSIKDFYINYYRFLFQLKVHPKNTKSNLIRIRFSQKNTFVNI